MSIFFLDAIIVEMSNEKSVISRVSAILRLFDENRPLITIDEIAAQLDVSPASAYRYAADLVEAGLLSRLFGRYRLGLKIIELEYLISTRDPVIAAAHDIMDELAHASGGNVLLCNMYDHTLVNVAHVVGQRPITLRYTKGLPMPLFQGSQAHVVLAHMERRRLKRLYEVSLRDPATQNDASALGADWPTFTKALRKIRKQGFYISRGELDVGVTGIAAPVFVPGNEVLGSLVTVMDQTSVDQASARGHGEEALVQMTIQAAKQLSQRIEHLSLD